MIFATLARHGSAPKFQVGRYPDVELFHLLHAVYPGTPVLCQNQRVQPFTDQAADRLEPHRAVKPPSTYSSDPVI